MQSPVPTEEEFQLWLHHPVTKCHQVLLTQWVEALKMSWALGNFSHSDLHAAAVTNAAAIGEVKAYLSILDLDYQQLKSELAP